MCYLYCTYYIQQIDANKDSQLTSKRYRTLHVLHYKHSVHCERNVSSWLCRARIRRWWLKVLDKSHDVTLPPSSSVEQAEGSAEMEGEVEFRRDPKSKLMKAVNGTECMYRRRALERGRRVCVCACVCVCVCACTFVYMCVHMWCHCGMYVQFICMLCCDCMHVNETMDN